MFKRRYLLVLISAVLFKNSHQNLLSFADVPEERVLPPSCDTSNYGKSYCTSCSASQFCLSPDMYDTPCTGSKPFCGLDTSNPPKYACVASNVDCECPGTPGLSYKPDPFNSHWYISCSGTDRVNIDCGTTNYYNPDKNDCSGSTATSTLCNTPGPNEDSDPTTCDGYVFCSSSLVVTSSGKCSSPTNYFNPSTRTCVSPIQPFRCQSGFIGKYGDPFDCRRYYVCNGDTLVAVGCCTATQIWDTTTRSCSTTVPTCIQAPPCASDGAIP